MRLLVAAAAALALLAPPATRARAEGADDVEAARIAWRYFERNTHPETGLVSSVDGYPSTTAWDLGSSLLAALAAHELGLLARADLEARLAKVVATLERLPLTEARLPNKAYHAATGAMTDYANAPAPAGIGTSAVDVARLVSALAAVGDRAPALRDGIARALSRWDLCALAADGQLFGVHRDGDGRLRRLQEGRLGYEQYAAKALALVGLDTSRARSYGAHLAELPVLGVLVPHDARDRARFGAVDALVTEPWALDALEFGLDDAARPLAGRVFEVQKRRWRTSGIVTALSEDHLDRPPWFVYDAIVAGGAPWRTVDAEGRPVDGVRGLSTKAAFALAALHADDPYAAILRAAVDGARDPERGWFAGLYERGGPNRALAANTNAVVLEAIAFARRGPLHGACAGCEGRQAWRARLAGLAGGGACLRADPGSGGAGGLAPGGADLAPAIQSPPGLAPRPRPAEDRGLRMDGSFALTYRGVDGPGAGGIATVWPWRSAFLRIGGEATPESDRGNARLLWGFGWDDWRGNTFHFTVHNWGPLRPEDAPGWRGAEANLGYKLPRLCSRSFCFAPVASVIVPFAGGPYADVRVTLTIARTWFVMGGIGRTIPDVYDRPEGSPQWRLVYGFGRWDWRPGTFFVTYHDWGPDWRARNGVLAAGVNWSF